MKQESHIRSKLIIFLKGMAMGAADSVPGVSGGTIAFITNIYEQLIVSIQSVNFRALRLLFREGPGAAWRHINGTFLLVLFLGILSSLVVLANTVLFLLDNYRQELLAFFCGLILASCWFVAGKITIRDWTALALAAAGCIPTVALAFVPQSSMEPGLAYIFFSGALAICAMILPGISGAFILILLGAYERVLDALRSFELLTIVVFAAGCGCGLIAFSNLLTWLFSRYRNRTLSFLLGILVGSLYSIWPWQTVAAHRVNEAGASVPVLYRNVWPGEFARLTGGEAGILAAAGLALAGFMLVYGLQRAAMKT